MYSYVALLSCVCCVCVQNVNESEAIQDELNEKVERLKAELVVFKSLMSDVSISISRDQYTVSLTVSSEKSNRFVFIIPS